MCFDANLEPDFNYDNIMCFLIASYIVVQTSGSFFKYVIKGIVYLGKYLFTFLPRIGRENWKHSHFWEYVAEASSQLA